MGLEKHFRHPLTQLLVTLIRLACNGAWGTAERLSHTIAMPALSPPGDNGGCWENEQQPASCA
jgi:hypothetical protein